MRCINIQYGGHVQPSRIKVSRPIVIVFYVPVANASFVFTYYRKRVINHIDHCVYLRSASTTGSMS